MEGQISTGAENDDLSDEPSKLRRPADPKIAIQCTALEDQCTRLITAPVQNALVEHAHGINDLGITRQRFRLRIRLCGMQIGFSQKRVRCFLVDQCNRNQYEAGYKANEAQAGMDQKHRTEIDWRQGGTSNKSSITGLEIKLLT